MGPVKKKKAQSDLDLEHHINTLLGNFSTLSARLKHLEFDTAKCGNYINVTCSYISFRDGAPTFDEFVDLLSHHIIPYCLPREAIRTAQHKLAEGDHVNAGRIMEQLSQRARSMFIKAKRGSHRSGEAGEIALYILTEWLLQAPQIVSKMYLKTNSQMPVFGTDGIHAKYDGNTSHLHLYWGESKAHAKLATALTSALESIAEFFNDGHDQYEITLVESHADLYGLDEAARDAILKYLDPYAEESNKRITTHSCLLVFSFEPPNSVTSESEAERRFIEEIREVVQSFISSIQTKVASTGLTGHRFEFFLLPVPSAQALRDKFQARIGWPHDD